MGGVGERRRIDAAGLRLRSQILQDRNRLAGFDIAKEDVAAVAGLDHVGALDHAADAMAAALEDGGEIRDDPVRGVIILEDKRGEGFGFAGRAGAHGRRRRI